VGDTTIGGNIQVDPSTITQTVTNGDLVFNGTVSVTDGSSFIIIVNGGNVIYNQMSLCGRRHAGYHRDGGFSCGGCRFGALQRADGNRPPQRLSISVDGDIAFAKG
jgi:hypothetical protein